jgi:site-specific recombinase XerD
MTVPIPPIRVVSRRRHLTSVVPVIVYPRVEEWETWQQAQGLSKRTIEARVHRVIELADFTATDPEDVTAQQIVKFMASVADRKGYKEEKASPSTLATYHSHLKAWFAWLAKMEYREANPIVHVPTPKADDYEPRAVTDRELDAIFSVGAHRRTRMMLLLAAYQGLRVHEIAKIRGEHVSLLDNKLRVIGKGRHDATLPLHPLVGAAAQDFPEKGYWFPTNAKGNANGKSGPILARSVSGIIGEVFIRAKVEGGAHRLRHWYATNLLYEGSNLKEVQKLMRHKSIQSTERYTDVRDADLAAAVARLRVPGGRVESRQSA